MAHVRAGTPNKGKSAKESGPDFLGPIWAYLFTQTAKTLSLVQKTGGYHQYDKNAMVPMT